MSISVRNRRVEEKKKKKEKKRRRKKKKEKKKERKRKKKRGGGTTPKLGTGVHNAGLTLRQALSGTHVTPYNI